MATGVLLLGIGRATRLLGHLTLASKGYDATIRLGQSTVTDDAEGEVVATQDTADVTDQAIATASARLTGDILQVPSAVSAVKIDGQRSYARVRAGQDVDIPARPVTISTFTVEDVRRHDGFVDLDVHVECSTGTYVRALARDLGAALDVGGHLTALRRTRVGSFTLHEAHALDAMADPEAGSLPVIPLDTVALRQFAWYVVPDDAVTAVRNGRAITARLRPTGEPVERAAPADETEHVDEATGQADGADDSGPTAIAPVANDAGVGISGADDSGPAAIAPVDGDAPTRYRPGERGEGPDGPVAVLAPSGQFLALYEQHGPTAKAVAVFAPA